MISMNVTKAATIVSPRPASTNLVAFTAHPIQIQPVSAKLVTTNVITMPCALCLHPTEVTTASANPDSTEMETPSGHETTDFLIPLLWDQTDLKDASTLTNATLTPITVSQKLNFVTMSIPNKVVSSVLILLQLSHVSQTPSAHLDTAASNSQLHHSTPALMTTSVF